MINSFLDLLETHTWLLFLFLGFFTLLTLGLTLLPADVIPSDSLFTYSTIGHILMFGIWTFILGLFLWSYGQKPLPLFSIFLAGALFGISVEILQEVLPTNRQMDPMDMLADIFGCLLAVLFLKVLTEHRKFI